MRSNGHDRLARRRTGFGPGGVSARAEFVAQAHIVVWDAGALCAERALGRFQDQAERTVKKRDQYFFSLLIFRSISGRILYRI